MKQIVIKTVKGVQLAIGDILDKAINKNWSLEKMKSLSGKYRLDDRMFNKILNIQILKDIIEELPKMVSDPTLRIMVKSMVTQFKKLLQRREMSMSEYFEESNIEL
jgi:hypothetical protein